MPLQVEYSEPARFQVTVDGRITRHDVTMLIERMLAHPKLQPGVDVLVDARRAANALSTLELRAIAREIRPMLDRGLGAVGVVTDNPFLYGVTRMFAVFAEAVGASVGAFQALEDAHVWLAERRARAPAES